MTNTHITAADLEELRINNRQPRAVRQCLTAEEAREALAQTHHVKTVAELADARRDLTQTIADVLGVTIKEVKLPHAHLVLANGAGVALTRWADDQREHMRAAVKANGLGNFHLSISPDIQRGVLAAWEARR